MPYVYALHSPWLYESEILGLCQHHSLVTGSLHQGSRSHNNGDAVFRQRNDAHPFPLDILRCFQRIVGQGEVHPPCQGGKEDLHLGVSEPRSQTIPGPSPHGDEVRCRSGRFVEPPFGLEPILHVHVRPILPMGRGVGLVREQYVPVNTPSLGNLVSVRW